MFTTYILYSPSHDRYYTGFTSSLESRIKKHNSGSSKSTKPFRPWYLVYKEDFETKYEARIREIKIKSYKSGIAFKKLVRVGTEAVKRGRL